jgi:CheY-like chemotaxis protein
VNVWVCGPPERIHGLDAHGRVGHDPKRGMAYSAWVWWPPMLTRVLMVDSDKAVTDGAVTILQGRGYRARGAYSAEEAIATSKDLQPNVLISDVVLKGMDGVELAAWFEANIPTCKVSLISFNRSLAGVSNKQLPTAPRGFTAG